MIVDRKKHSLAMKAYWKQRKEQETIDRAAKAKVAEAAEAAKNTLSMWMENNKGQLKRLSYIVVEIRRLEKEREVQVANLRSFLAGSSVTK